MLPQTLHRHDFHAKFWPQAALASSAVGSLGAEIKNGRTFMTTAMRMSVLASAAFIAMGGSALAQQQPPQSPNMTFFVTSAGPGKGGDLGGLDGADRHCQQLAQAAGAGGKTWRAYLSGSGANAVNARDRIGKGPWVNFKGEQVAKDVDELHSEATKVSGTTALTERGTVVAGVGWAPNQHDMLTGSTDDGKAWPPNLNLTCNNWTSSTFGSAMLGHHDRTGGANKSWNSAHMSRSCSAPDLVATGGNGLFYCFAQ
jgi:hypothetical protein